MTLTSRIESIGSAILGGGRTARGILRLSLGSFRGVVRRDYPRGEVARQMYIIGNKSLFFICITMGFLGMVMVMQSGEQIHRITGDLSPLGAQFLRLFIQEFAPTITALMLATRVGAGIAAEIGSMVVSEQIDALRLSGITPVSYLITPRLVASVAMTYVLTVFAVVVTFTAGGLAAWSVFGLNPHVFFDSSQVHTYDIVLGSCKALAYGSAIPIIAGYCGMQARGGSEGVGSATTNAVIAGSFAVLQIDFLFSGIGFVFFGGGL